MTISLYKFLCFIEMASRLNVILYKNGIKSKKMTVHRWSTRSYLALPAEIKDVKLEFGGMGLACLWRVLKPLLDNLVTKKAQVKMKQLPN